MIATLADVVGFRYFYDEELGQYAHSAGVMLLTPGGRLSRYFFGIEFDPSDLRLGLVEASASTIGTPIDQVLLLCYSNDPSLGKYNNVVMNALLSAAVSLSQHPCSARKRCWLSSVSTFPVHPGAGTDNRVNLSAAHVRPPTASTVRSVPPKALA